WWLEMFTPPIRAMRPSYSSKFAIRLEAVCSAAASALPLLVARILADDPHDTLAPDHLAVPADPLHRSLYPHRPLHRGRSAARSTVAPRSAARSSVSRLTWHGKQYALSSDRTASAPPSPCRPAGCGCSACASCPR